MINNKLYIEKIENRIGKFQIVESLRESSKRTSVFKLSANGEYYYLKLFNRRARFEPEIFAYKNWNKVVQKSLQSEYPIVPPSPQIKKCLRKNHNLKTQLWYSV